jgi:hypothetical protein
MGQGRYHPCLCLLRSGAGKVEGYYANVSYLGKLLYLNYQNDAVVDQLTDVGRGGGVLGLSESVEM